LLESCSLSSEAVCWASQALAIRDDDECREELVASKIQLAVAEDIRRDAEMAARKALARLESMELSGF
jgi:hypothetical protein